MVYLRHSLVLASILATTPARAFVAPGGGVARSPLVQATALTPPPRRNIQPLRMIGSLMDLLGGGDAELISPEKALKGRDQKMPNIDGLKHYVLGNDLQEVPEGYKVAVFANGCK